MNGTKVDLNALYDLQRQNAAVTTGCGLLGVAGCGCAAAVICLIIAAICFGFLTVVGIAAAA